MTNPLPLPRPGKIIAVHLAYESRAAQRGRRPDKPSYFLKPSSSLAASGAALERPEGTELLAFEGEIALIIGSPARQVPLQQAWEHVAYVTAANDLGIYDYRLADKGSNLRSKGRDGYTPLGPKLIDARTVSEDQLRIRTWVNGKLVQQDSTAAAKMIFPLSQFVADLSQHLTLETGDIILTGTPAGSTVIQPGDLVEVEVDAPSAAGAPSSGRLITPIISGRGDFNQAIGSLPTVDEKQAEEAWGSRQAAGLPPLTEAETQPPRPTLTPQLRRLLEATPTAGLSAQLRARGLNNIVIEGVYPQTPGSKMVGTAKTLRYLPNREDLFKAKGGGYNAQKRCFDQVGEGEVIVIEARGEKGSATLGDVLALRAKNRGAAGIITDGGVRDYAAVQEIGLPVFSAGPHPAVLGRRHVPWEVDVAVACGNATVLPGDIIVADDDGAIVIPPDLAAEIAQAAYEKEQEDSWVAQEVAAGHRLEGLFPPSGPWKEAYKTWKAQQEQLEEEGA
ncbi:MAG: fumarylacetoacetate hydrolase family protein [Rothia sp. (in: high G+C Gram-positive bacteria)]|nr:fumarylacetoacetate hydrolase family protein [Rothia sp. (in: high G+C Gram-positive bacteria)]